MQAESEGVHFKNREKSRVQRGSSDFGEEIESNILFRNGYKVKMTKMSSITGL
ncbi:hypothetical protein ATPR_2719 [Acetobacter tropicalis NBRC 101654]|uniref:Uncharacterized protein n=1 Tax=Acetobacter tropicalis NBRC 101654 TaxID=749388 RepID=F7VH70_9PROT|nr:hypothetical protein ATPR_2719 [Acetobacter tropicalis NBRC 101654]